MKSRALKSIHLLLVLLILSAAAAPACMGMQGCAMACCRQTAEPGSGAAGQGHGLPCCADPTPSSDVDPGCRYLQANPAATAPVDATAPIGIATNIPSVIEAPGGSDGHGSQALSRPPARLKIPLYLRIQTLLI